MCSGERRSAKRRRRSGGFSLLEALAATSLVGGALFGMGLGAVALSRNVKSADSTAAATALALEKLEQLRSMPLGAAAFAPGIYYDAANPMTADGTLGGIYRRSWVVSEKDEPQFGLQTVEVTVEWKDSKAHDTSVAAYVRCSKIPCP